MEKAGGETVEKVSSEKEEEEEREGSDGTSTSEADSAAVKEAAPEVVGREKEKEKDEAVR